MNLEDLNIVRKQAKGRKTSNISEELSELFNYTVLTQDIENKLQILEIPEGIVTDILSIIQKEAENKSKLLKNIQNTIAIYQGQATLGKIITVLLHEGRKPIGYFRQQAPNLSNWLINYRESRDWEDPIFDKLLDRLNNFHQQSEILAHLFRRLDPLAKQRRGNRNDFSIIKAINKARDIFESTIKELQVDFQVFCNEEETLFGWEDDLIIAVTNLIENSLYWLDVSSGDNGKKITIEVINDGDNQIIHYKDSGPGIEEKTIKSGVIFEPGYSKKIDGTGLGLPIAGEALDRLNGSIIAHHLEEGAYFTLEFKKHKDT